MSEVRVWLQFTLRNLVQTIPPLLYLPHYPCMQGCCEVGAHKPQSCWNLSISERSRAKDRAPSKCGKASRGLLGLHPGGKGRKEGQAGGLVDLAESWVASGFSSVLATVDALMGS